MRYREMYIKTVGKIEKGFEVHHIDLNRKNNNILNLVALPKEFHREYHEFLEKNYNFTYCNISIIPNEDFNNFEISAVKLLKLENMINKISNYISKRNKILIELDICDSISISNHINSTFKII